MTYPVSMDDIRDAAGYSSLNLKTLVQNGAWNKWAKFKFVRRPGIGYKSQLDSTTKTWKGSADWWKADDGKCGLTFTTATSLGNASSYGSFLYSLRMGDRAWTYARPRGQGRSPKEWYRMWDLIGYWADAPQPIDSMPDSIMLRSDDRLVVQPVMNRGDAYSLHLTDFAVGGASLEDFYLGVLVYRSMDQFTFKTSDQTIGTEDPVVTFTNMLAYAGRTATIVPFLSSKRIAVQGTDPGAGVYLGADVPPKSVMIKAYTTGLQTEVTAQWRSPLYVRCGYTVRLVNDTAAAITVTGIAIALYRSDTQAALDTDTVASVTVPAGGAEELTGILLEEIAHSTDAAYTVEVTSTGGVATGSCAVDEPRT